MSIKNKVSLITGAASGIGKGIAEHFAERGAQIVIADLNLENAQKSASEIEKKFKVATLAVAMDVSKPEEVQAGVDAAIKKFGRIDNLVSNAGIQIIASFIDFPYADWRKMMAIHLDGAFLTAQACMREMIKTGGGSIIFIGSVHSVEASKEKSAYVTAKHGLVGLTRAIAKEGAAYNVRANLIGPGFVKTPLVDKQIPEQAKALGISETEVVKKIMLGETIDGEFTTVAEVAEVAAFLFETETRALSGQTILVSHGWRML